MRVILQIDLILKQVKSYHTPRKKERGKGGDLIETRQEADQKAEDQARTSGARPGKLAGRQTEAELGPQSYIAAAFEGCFDVAEQNIEDDFACSMKQRAETAEQQLAYNRRELDDAKKRLKELGGLVDSLKEENRSLGLRLTRSVFPSDLYLDLWTLATKKVRFQAGNAFLFLEKLLGAQSLGPCDDGQQQFSIPVLCQHK